MHAVKGKQPDIEPKMELVATRVSTEVRDGFKRLAAGQHRSVSGELRRMIEDRVAAAELEEAA